MFTAFITAVMVALTLVFAPTGQGLPTIIRGCQVVQESALNPSPLTGVVVFRERSQPDGFTFLNVTDGSRSNLRLPDHIYLAMSPDRQWVLTYIELVPVDLSKQEVSREINTEFWLHSTNGQDSQVLLGERDAQLRDETPGDDIFWVDDQRVFISWFPNPFQAPDIQGIVAIPFTDWRTWEEITLHTPYQWVFERMSYDLQHELILAMNLPGSVFAIYTIADGHLVHLPPPIQPFPEMGYPETMVWLHDGSLSVVMQAQPDADRSVSGQEIYLATYPFEVFTPLTDLTAEFEPMGFLSIGGPSGRVVLNWSADSNRVLFLAAPLSEVGDSVWSDPNAALYVYDRTQDRTERLCLSVGEVPDNGWPGRDTLYPALFRWSPDGQYVAFVEDGTLYALHIDQQQLVRLADDVTEIYDWQ